jgi:hypothetical protein
VSRRVERIPAVSEKGNTILHFPPLSPPSIPRSGSTSSPRNFPGVECTWHCGMGRAVIGAVVSGWLALLLAVLSGAPRLSKCLGCITLFPVAYRVHQWLLLLPQKYSVVVPIPKAGFGKVAFSPDLWCRWWLHYLVQEQTQKHLHSTFRIFAPNSIKKLNSTPLSQVSSMRNNKEDHQ